MLEVATITLSCCLFKSTRPPLMFCGMQDGSLRAYPLREEGLSEGALKDYWYLNVHDNENGQIRGICCSHDDGCLITCGGDGNIFTFDLLSEEEVPKELKVTIPPPRVSWYPLSLN